MQNLIFSLQDSESFVDGRQYENSDLAHVPADAIALTLEGTSVDDDGLKHLDRLKNLRCLDLDGTRITDRGLSVVAEFASLEELWLEGTKITDSGVRSLRSLRKLRFLSLAYTDVGTECMMKLRLAIPGLEIGT